MGKIALSQHKPLDGKRQDKFALRLVALRPCEGGVVETSMSLQWADGSA